MIYCREKTRQRKRGLYFWGEGKLWEGECLGKLMEDKGYLVRFVMQTKLAVSSDRNLWGLRVVLLFLVWGTGEDTFTYGSLCPDFRHKGGGQRVPPASAVSQLPSVQKSPYAKVAYFGVAYSDPFQHPSTHHTYNG